jgi:hypothetical protein
MDAKKLLKEFEFAPTEVSKHELVAWASLGLVGYIRGSFKPAWPNLLKVWDLIWSANYASGFTHARFWDEMEWRSLGSQSGDSIRAHLEAGAGERRFWRVEVVNRITAPDFSIEFGDLNRTLDPERSSFVRFRFPLDFAPQRLFEIAKAVLDLPVWHGTAGYIFSAVETERDLAYDQLWTWARRYWGFQVIDLHAGTWDAVDGLLGINWLTLLGKEFMSAKELSPLSESDFSSRSVSLHRSEGGAIVKAGSSPIVGDLNLLEDISAYAAVAQTLSNGYVEEPTQFPGMFTDHQSTLAWIRRFTEPSKWIDPELS